MGIQIHAFGTRANGVALVVNGLMGKQKKKLAERVCIRYSVQ
jgi:hypothetical protein